MNKILIYGPGCAKCTALAEITKQAMQELGVSIPLEKVTDAMQFAVAGVLMTPALAVDGKILISGKVPTKDEVKRILKEALANNESPGFGCGCSRVPETAAQANTTTPEGCGCGSGGCCGGAQQRGRGWKKAVVWVAALLVLLAIVKMINRQDTASGSDTAAAVSLRNGVDVIYYEYGARCITCIRMEKWTDEVIHQDFSSELKEGSLSFRAVPADEAAVEKYGLTTKSLIVKVRENGKEARWLNLDRIWDLSGDEEAFKAYVTESIRKQLGEVK